MLIVNILHKFSFVILKERFEKHNNSYSLFKVNEGTEIYNHYLKNMNGKYGGDFEELHNLGLKEVKRIHEEIQVVFIF